MYLTNNFDESSIVVNVFLFYCLFTICYHFLLIGWLYFMDQFRFLGKSTFFSVLVFILIAETLKFSIANRYLAKREQGLGERHKKIPPNKNRFRDLTRGGFALSSGLVGYFVFSILFGAGLFDEHEETFMLSALLTCLTVWPALMHFGSHGAFGMLLGVKPTSGDYTPLAELLLGSVQLCVAGAWLGAFVIPLDWDRPWQAWPIPCSTGALLGHAAAHFLGLVSFVPRVMKFMTTSHNRPGKKIK